MAACRSAAALGAAALAGFGGLAYVIRRRALARRRRTSCACLACDALRASSTPPRAAKRRPSAMEPAPEDSTPVNNDRLNSNPVATSKRESALTWDEYFMAVAFLSAQRSKDPNRQVGACVVNADKKIVGIGYNGFPWGCSDDDLPWGKRGDSALETKYPYVCHAELNAIMNANSTTLKGCKIYVTLFPCNECAKLIIQARIASVIFFADSYHDSEMTTASKRMLKLAGVEMCRFDSSRRRVALDFDAMC